MKKLSVQHVAMLVLVTSTLAGLLHAPFPIPRAINVWMPAAYASHPDPGLGVVQLVIGNHESLSLQGNVGAHFSQHPEVYLFPNKLGTADKIILRLESPTLRLLPQQPGMLFTLAHHLQMRPADYLAQVSCLLHGKRYGVALWSEPWLVLEKGWKQARPEGDREILQRLESLRQQWQVNPQDVSSSMLTCNGA